jgi:hypothetical protein
VRVPVGLPLQGIGIGAVGYVIDYPRMSGKTGKAILTLPQNGLFPVLIPIDYLGRLSYVRWRSREGARDFLFLSLYFLRRGLLLSGG